MTGIIARQAGVEGHAAVGLAFTGGGGLLPRTFGFQLTFSGGLCEARKMSRDGRRFDQGSAVRTFDRHCRSAESLRHLEKSLADGVGLVVPEFEPADLCLECVHCRRELLADIARPGAPGRPRITITA